MGKFPMRREDISSQRLGDEVVLYDAMGDAVHVLNPTAQLIWELCDGEHSIEDMEAAIRKDFSVDPGEDLVGDIQRAIDELKGKKLLIEKGL